MSSTSAMPHKKKKAFHRNAERAAKDFYEKPLKADTTQKKKLKADDDMPKSFLRIVNRKSRKELIAEGKIQVNNKPILTIEKGESLHDFRQRVDKEIPVRIGGMNREQRPKKKPKPKPETDELDEDLPKKKRRRGGGKKKRSVSPDPWARLAKDVPFNQPVQAPPSLPPPSRKVKSSLPSSLSGARREVLEAERLDVIARYRQRMGRTE